MINQPFTVPKVVKYDDLNKSWYVFFRYKGKLCRYKKGINYVLNYNKRLIEANSLKNALHVRLKTGWNPLIPDAFETGSEMNLLQALDFALEKKKDTLAPKTYLDYRGSVKFVKTAIVALNLNYIPVVDTKRVHVKTILEKIKLQRKASNNSYNKYLDHFRAVLSELIQWDIIPINPANNIKNLPVAESRANIPATPEQHKIIKNHLQSQYSNFYNFIVTIFHTGIRPEEILKIQLSMIDLSKFEIVLPSEITKTNKERIVPINKHLLEVYKSMDFENLPKQFYLFGSFRESGKGNAGIKLDFISGPTKIKRDTATKRWNTIVKVGLGFQEVNMYSNKHAGANAKILAGMDLDALRELYGHTSKLMTTKYATVVKEVYRKQIMENSPDF
jgi:integrase